MRRAFALLLLALAAGCARVPRGVEIAMDGAEEPGRLVRGWSGAEGEPGKGFRWIEGTSAKVFVGDLPREGEALLEVVAWPYRPAALAPQRMQLWVDGVFLAEWTMERGEKRYAVRFPARVLPREAAHLYVVLDHAARPAGAEPGNGDPRPLSAAVRRISLRVRPLV